MIELEDTISDIREDMSGKDQELLKIRIKIRQADIERERLEQELAILRKQLGPNKGRGKNIQ